MRRAWSALLACSAAFLPNSPARGQWQASADVGVSHLRQTGIPESVAQTLGASVDALGGRTWLHAAVLSSLQPSDAWTGQAFALGGVSGRLTTRSQWELGAALSEFGQTGLAATGSGEGSARLRIGGPLGGISLGGAGGGESHDGQRSALARGFMDAWWTVANERVFASITRTRIGTFGYSDLGVAWRHDGNGASAGASAGLRTARNGGWQSADAELWVLPRLALVLAAGNALPDVVRGTPSTRYLSASIRIAFQPRVTLWPARSPARGVRVAVTRRNDHLVRIDVATSDATRVDLMADFTDWKPIALEHGDKTWYVERPIATGLHRFAIRLDGGAWVAPSNVPSVEDDLGGTVGLITVP